MLTRSKSLIFLLIMAVLFLSACGPDVGISVPDPDGDDSGDYEEMSEEQAAEGAEEGSANVYYHYLMTHPDLEFKIEPIIPVFINEGKTPGSFDVEGIGATRVTMRMAGGSGSYRCNIHCDVTLNFEVDTEIQLDENTGECTIPMMFIFQAQADEWILETDCPDPAGAAIDCAALSIVMADPYVYTFTKYSRDVKLPSESGVTLQAEIRDVVMPRGVKGICNW